MSTEAETELAPGRDEVTYCVFKAADQDFLVQVDLVREIVDLAPVYPLPLAPRYIHGVVPLRGDVIPAIDLAQLYSLGSTIPEEAKLVVVEEGAETIGFISEIIPFFISLASAATGENIINVSDFFQRHRIREHTRGQN